jgi:aspartyl-tRNA(Asn)/glutamyl-tRNA(Gln) amidotransferase subunit B
MSHPLWEPVIGLEIHAQLNTKSKIFSSAPNQFGSEPNTNITVVCTGQPGALPVLNSQAVKKAVQFGLAVQAEISLVSTFDRKSYFYPDTPRNFQITQYENPIVRKGTLITDVDGQTKTFQINRAHLEDDAGMLRHFNHFAGIDYNRAGAPLIEIVSEPCIHSAKDASSYAKAIRAILLYLDASDGNMEEGSLRIDVNISVRPKGEKGLRPRVEIKNMNSFSFLEIAIETEVSRQIALYEKHPEKPHLELIPPGTYRWDPETQKTLLMRTKESADDYRYFPEPDLAPIVLSQEYIDEIRGSLPELPRDKFNRYVTDLGLTEYAATTLVVEKKLADYFEKALQICLNPRSLCNWITVEFAGRFKDSSQSLLTSQIPPEHVGLLVQMIDQNKINGPIAKAVADEMVQSPLSSPEWIVKNNPDYQPLDNEAIIEDLVCQVLKENNQSVIDFKNGHKKAFSFLVGQVMKLSKGKASPQIVNALLQKKLS